MPVSSDRFCYNRDTKTMSAEVSDLGDVWVQAYPDAADMGIEIISSRTGKSVMFVVHEEKWNDGDLLYWVLKAVKNPRNHAPIFDQLTVVVYND